MKYKVKVTQAFKLYRECEVEVYADSLEQAIEFQQENNAPDYGDPCWKDVSITMMDEEVTAA